MEGQQDHGQDTPVVDLTDPAVEAAMAAEVDKRVAKKDAEYEAGLQNLYQYSDILDSPTFETLKNALRQGKQVKITEVGAEEPPSGGGQGGMEEYFQRSKQRMIERGMSAEMAAVQTEEMKALAQTLMTAGNMQVAEGTKALKEGVEGLRKQVDTPDVSAKVRDMYFMNEEILDGTSMKDLGALGIEPKDVLEELNKFQPGSPAKPIIQAMIARKNSEHFSKRIADDRAAAENAGRGMPGGGGANKRLKVEISEHKFGERPSLRSIAKEIGGQVGKSEDEIEAHFAKVT
jgi:hypothetical protein